MMDEHMLVIMEGTTWSSANDNWTTEHQQHKLIILIMLIRQQILHFIINIINK